jgi:hypothetical protein
MNAGDATTPGRRRVVRIIGASYSGSTALGYFLNTGANVVFGSELYRLLPAFTAPQRDTAPTLCDHCGENCPWWSPALRARLQAQPDARLRDLYDAIFAHPDWGTRVLVDGTKSIRWYADAAEERYDIAHVVTTKHPLRLISSYLYNHRTLIPRGARRSLETCNRYLLEHREAWWPTAETWVRRLAAQYAEIEGFLQGREALWCATDDETQVMATLAKLGARLGETFDPARMAEVPCHSIGGNRSLVWQARRYEHGPLLPVQDGARFDYYRAAPKAGFLRDDKYRQLLAGGLGDAVATLARRHALFERLRYPGGA